MQDELRFSGLPTQPGGEYDYRLDGRQPLVVTDAPFAKWVVGLDYTFNRHLYLNVQWVHGLVDEFGAGDFISGGVSVRSGGVDKALTTAEVFNCADPLQLGADPPGQRCAVEVSRPRLGDYLVIGLDAKMLSDKLLARLFVILDLVGVDEERFDAALDRRVRRHHSPFSAEGFSAVIFPQLTYNFGFGVELSTGALVKLGKRNTKFGDPAAGGSEVWTRARFSF